MSKAIMIQGTGSGVGKSAIVAALCRIFRDMGIRVAPFKSQNMALNSFITREGGEIGRSQALQAEAAGIEPCNEINPVLLKAASDSRSQVILNGKVFSTMNARDYYSINDKVWEVITSAYDSLSEKYDLIVIEGAGSPAEINLKNEEVVNMKVARYADALVILVGDIDKGGVFASLYGTVELLKDHVGARHAVPLQSDADYIKAFIINKFRGDVDILRPGLRQIEDKTGKPVIGVINYCGDLGIHEEDGIPAERLNSFSNPDIKRKLKIVVLRLRYISNFTDFDPFMFEPDVELVYSHRHEDLNNADLIIIPGSKNTVSDLLFLRENGLEKSVKAAVEKGIPVAGICGGYQMLGKKIYDPFSVESDSGEVDGMGLLDIFTTLDKVKTTCQVEAEMISGKWEVGSGKLKGYEIHMGNTTGDVGLFKIKRYTSHFSLPASDLIPDGSIKDNVWGTYIHGIFDNDDFRHSLLNDLRQKKNMDLQNEALNYYQLREEALNIWAGIVKNSIDVCFILRQIGMEKCLK